MATRSGYLYGFPESVGMTGRPCTHILCTCVRACVHGATTHPHPKARLRQWLQRCVDAEEAKRTGMLRRKRVCVCLPSTYEDSGVPPLSRIEGKPAARICTFERQVETRKLALSGGYTLSHRAVSCLPVSAIAHGVSLGFCVFIQCPLDLAHSYGSYDGRGWARKNYPLFFSLIHGE